MNRVLLALSLMLLAGCASDDVWKDLDDKSRPVADYRQGPLVEKLRQMPVVVEFNCPETAMVNERGCFGGISVGGRFMIQKLVQRECEEFIGANFRPAMQGDKTWAVLKVSMTKVLVLQKWADSISEMSFRFEIVHSDDVTKRVYFSRTFDGLASSRKRARGIVPASAYAAMQDILRKLGKDLSSNALLIARLAADFPVNAGFGEIRHKELIGFQWLGESEGVSIGSCSYRCNDDDPSMVRSIASDFIQEMCLKKLGDLAREHVRIVVDKDDFDGTSKTWNIRFRTFARTKFAFTYDKTSRSGYCTVDLGLLGLDASQAAGPLLEYVQRQVERFGRVRMQTSRTDAQKELLTISFIVE